VATVSKRRTLIDYLYHLTTSFSTKVISRPANLLGHQLPPCKPNAGTSHLRCISLASLLQIDQFS
jgi:hypothetical protein